MRTDADRAEDAPATTAVGDPAFAGRARRRRGQMSGPAVVAVAVLAVLALVVGAAALLQSHRPERPAAEARSEALHLPEAVNAPGTWSDDEEPDGPLAALGLAMRNRAEGLTDKREQLQLFGVSAVDGRSAWVNLQGVHEETEALVGWFALSPDGRWIGWSRHQKAGRAGIAGPLLGWAVMDTRTGDVRELADPTARRLRDTASDLAFSGDSRYLLTSYEKPSSPRTRGHRFVAWDIEDGTPKVLEEPGHYWLPNLGSAPSGVVWSRGSTVYRVDPATGESLSYSLPQSVVTASWAPDDRAFAYIGRPAGRKRGPWRLFGGRTITEARNRVLPLEKGQPGQLLGWRDSRHVVVGDYRTTVQIVDVVTGEVVPLDMAGEGKTFNAPLLAANLWQNPLTAPAPPTGTTDPRRPFRWGGAVLLVLLAGTLVVRRRRSQE